MQEKLKTSTFGFAFMAMGVLIVFMVLANPDAAQAPLWVIEAAAGAFFFAGASIVAAVFGATLLSRLSSLMVVYLMAVPGLWMLFGDATSCSVSVAIAGTATRGGGDPVVCRVVFGGGGLLVLAVALLFTWKAIREGRRPRQTDPAA